LANKAPDGSWARGLPGLLGAPVVLAAVAAATAVIATELVHGLWPGARPADATVISASVVFAIVLALADRRRLHAALTARRFQRALDRGAVSVSFQPVVELRGDRVKGAEALVRWTDPRRGPISPEAFVGQLAGRRAERTLTSFVLEQALTALAGWRADGRRMRVSINVSLEQLGGDLEAEVVGALQAHGVPADALVIELTEGDAAATRVGEYVAAVGRLSSLGVHIALDDFGRASSSLSRLSLLAVSVVKIDRSFVAAMDRRVDAEVLRHTISLAHSLGIQIVAEGVETEHQWRQLAVWGCDLVQGFLISRPLPPEQLTAWLDDEAPATLAALTDAKRRLPGGVPELPHLGRGATHIP
jgi:EAL domain-containing protein (putative c-di-GMP-specific phosphodiesterase class I)